MSGNLTLVFPSLNYSLQIGDMAYYTNYVPLGGFAVGNSNIIEIGPVVNIDDSNPEISAILVDMDPSTIPPTSNSFILFSKDNKANLSSIVGYYGEAQFKNNSKKKAELFAVACEISESSK